MTAHFWLSAESVALTLEQIASMTDEQARLFLAELRWGCREQQACPECGVIDRHYNIRTRKQWRCKHCFRIFSVTTGTPFADHKIREAVMLMTAPDKLKGVVEVDGGHFSGKKRKGRKKKPKAKPEDKADVPAKHSQQRDKVKPSAFPFHPNRRIVMVLREISSPKAVDFVHGELYWRKTYYVSCVLRSPPIQAIIEGTITGVSNRTRIESIEEFMQIPIPKPATPAKQKAIVDKLRAAFRAQDKLVSSLNEIEAEVTKI